MSSKEMTKAKSVKGSGTTNVRIGVQSGKGAYSKGSLCQSKVKKGPSVHTIDSRGRIKA